MKPMSIAIKQHKCIGCGKCLKVCPGNLIEANAEGKALIKCPKECWGCTACLKECPVEAIEYYLGLDIGGQDGRLTVKDHGESLIWYIKDKSGKTHQIKTHKKESNKY